MGPLVGSDIKYSDKNSSLEDRSGNFGTLDTISALKWIKQT